MKLASVLLLFAFASAAHAGKPNVLFVISDDLNTALSGLGHPECRTPNLDKFAETGVTFTRAFCQFPLCGPSRASIMSGQYPLVNGVTGNGGHLNPQRMTLPRYFGSHGYWNARVSKIFHMGIPIDIVQGTPGRDHAPSWAATHDIRAMETLTPGKVANFTEPEVVAGYPGLREQWQAIKPGDKSYSMPRSVRGDFAVVEVADRDASLLPDTMAADKAIGLLQQQAKQKQPFFLAVGFVRPHFPFISTESSLRSYDPKTTALPKFPSDDQVDMPAQAIAKDMNLTDDAVRKLRRGYYGAVGFMDEQFGRLMAELDRLKLRDNTIVVFVSDHGYLLGEHRMWKKSRLWEEAIRTPLIISAPGRARGVRCNRVVELVDLYPTLAELAGLPPEPGTQGQSLVPLLENPGAKRDKKDAWIFTGRGHGLRTERWAFMWYPAKRNRQEAFMLYDMKSDPGQFTNLASNPKYAGVKTRLHSRLRERIVSVK